ncbi:hypothetical protein YC2023_103524 [Brassica napus]|uniref:(rape) hypothetical protein n=1 Tax=Brassica napus TaxID=3708 RepID=A0A816UR32_BRANA|nr:unnamed protein product [Brassica napus]
MVKIAYKQISGRGEGDHVIDRREPVTYARQDPEPTTRKNSAKTPRPSNPSQGYLLELLRLNYIYTSKLEELVIVRQCWYRFISTSFLEFCTETKNESMSYKAEVFIKYYFTLSTNVS